MNNRQKAEGRRQKAASHIPLGPVLAITSGDPCGVGPEVILKTLTQSLPTPRIAPAPASARGGPGRQAGVRPTSRLIVIGDLAIYQHTAKALRLRLPRWVVTTPRDTSVNREHPLTFVDLKHAWRFTSGRTSVRAGAASLAYLKTALQLWRQGAVDGLVTAPVTKWTIERSHPTFQGQTEFLAESLGVSPVVMMFVAEQLRVALLTRHLALRKVSSSVTKPLVRQTARMVAETLRRDFGIRQPRLAMCGLNPHAGEGGLFGDEERRVLLPVLRELKRDGVVIHGPFAADGFFATMHKYDAVLCWYHDQGLIPFKLLTRDAGCQMSVGLPLVRTSPDHGSALDIAGKGLASPGSMRYAITLAAQLTKRVRSP